tara:strand:+ start:26411 stop:26611 length:201 start_codon:yes stop_codon:yes gene_type:complete
MTLKRIKKKNRSGLVTAGKHPSEIFGKHGSPKHSAVKVAETEHELEKRIANPKFYENWEKRKKLGK